MERPKYFVKTGYHYWQVLETETHKSFGSFSARKYKGDDGARAAARELCDKLNGVAPAAPDAG